MESFIQYVSEFERRIGMRPGFFNALIREDDWSFVIKLHAFLEACLTHAICSRLGRPELENVIARLDTSNNQSGKLAFAKKLGLLNKPQRRYVAALSQLRNDLVHDARAVDFRFDAYMSKLTEEQRYQFCVALSLDEMFVPDSEPDELRIISFVNEAPKFGIAYAGSIVIAELLLHASAGDLDKELKRVGKVTLERIFGKIQKIDDVL
jgi:hypothetical protein